MLVGGDDAFQQALAVRFPDDDVESETEHEPGGTRVARAHVRRDRDDPDRERQQRADERRQWDAADGERHAVRAAPIRLAEPELDHGQLRRGESEQHAEAEKAREEEHRMLQRGSAGQQDDRDRCRRDDRLRGHERPLAEPAELARKLSVLAERIREPAEPGDRRRRSRDEDQRARQADEHL